MYFLVKNVDAWWEHIKETEIVEKQGVRMSLPKVQPWQMKDFSLLDPSGVCWCFGENI